MRFKQVFEAAFNELMIKAKANCIPIFVIITCEKMEQLDLLGNIQFKNRAKLDLPEMSERAAILDNILGESIEEDTREISKYL